MDIEISNNTNKFIVLPLDTNFLDDYESNLNTVGIGFHVGNNIKFGLSFYDNLNNLVEHGIKSHHYKLKNEEFDLFNLKENASKIYEKSLIKYFKKKELIKILNGFCF